MIKNLVIEAATKRAQYLGKSQKWDEAAREFEKIAHSVGDTDARACYLYGNSLFQLQRYADSLKWTQRAVDLDSSNPRWYVRLGALLERAKRHGEAATAYKCAHELDSQTLEWQLRLARALVNNKNFEEAREVLVSANHQHPNSAEVTRELIRITLLKSPTWQRIEALESGLAADSTVSDWHERLGTEYRSLGQYERSAMHHLSAATAGSADESNLFGYVLAKYKEDPNFFSNPIPNVFPTKGRTTEQLVLDAGNWFYNKGEWIIAHDFLSESPERIHPDADSFYRTGLAADRCHRWETASRWLTTALEFNPQKSKWHYRLGLTLERQQKFAEAVEAYSAAVRMDSHSQPYWHYRIGYCLTKLDRVDEALEAFLQSGTNQSVLVDHVVNSESVELHEYDEKLYGANLRRLAKLNDAGAMHARGLDLLRQGQHSLAFEFLTGACLRDPDQNETWYFQKGLAAFACGNKRVALEAFLCGRTFATPHGISAEQYLKQKWRRDLMEYSEFFDVHPISQGSVLYESYFGSQISCNPLAIYKHLISAKEYQGLTHYWVVNEQTEIPEIVKNHEQTIVVKRGSRLFLKLLATSEVLINNVTFPHYFTRRDGQKYLNTWHGTPLKTLGKDIQTGFMEHANVSRNFMQATHLLAPNEHTEHVLVNRYDVEGLFTGQVVRTGTPRIDEILGADSEKTAAIRDSLGIHPDQKIVFYAPTWRGSLDTKYFDTDALLETLSTLNSRDDVALIFRAHHMTEKLLEGLDIDAIIAPQGISSNALLTVSDVLVTDYSSIFFDYLALNRPIIYHVPDLDEYKAERGLYLDLNELPGYVSRNRDELEEAMERALTDGTPDVVLHRQIVQQFAPYEDGSAAAKTARVLFDDHADNAVAAPAQEKPVLLFHQSLLPNGITSAFLNLVAAINPEEYRVVFLFDPAPFSKEPLRMEKFKELPDHVQVIARVGAHLTSLEERWVIDKFNAWHDWGSSEQERIYRSGFQREFRRLFGVASFATSIEFDGYAPFWSALMASSSDSATHISYMHNRIYKEWSTKYPELAGTMRINRWYDSLLSVSAATNEINREELSDVFAIAPTKFKSTNNLINTELIESLTTAELDSDLIEFIGESHEVWLSIGRMSPEKAHLKLFTAFKEHLVEKPTAKLILLGDGPLRSELELFISRNGLGEAILLAGQRSNPFPLMERCDGFVLGSDHEGQPMVLLEALTLGKRVLATDIVGNRGVLEPNFGLLVDNSVSGLVQGFHDMNTIDQFDRFDARSYCDEALKTTLNDYLEPVL
ncbi:glycosyltransferase [Glutamicibacter halophytocola]|uniref:Glycosyltransferase n=1 Tax=Glutamicibacter halophytocola TaxID=1933880 RepID=A0ABX5Y4P0_9MICC|nr:CDP-glycerol glycerophosphotransferase family protein [Glutamicibacter halophytocola]QDY65069.1 glycosyltransferase [Glutamicibacter halophytocola]